MARCPMISTLYQTMHGLGSHCFMMNWGFDGHVDDRALLDLPWTQRDGGNTKSEVTNRKIKAGAVPKNISINKPFLLGRPVLGPVTALPQRATEVKGLATA